MQDMQVYSVPTPHDSPIHTIYLSLRRQMSANDFQLRTHMSNNTHRGNELCWPDGTLAPSREGAVWRQFATIQPLVQHDLAPTLEAEVVCLIEPSMTSRIDFAYQEKRPSDLTRVVEIAPAFLL